MLLKLSLTESLVKMECTSGLYFCSDAFVPTSEACELATVVSVLVEFHAEVVVKDVSAAVGAVSACDVGIESLLVLRPGEFCWLARIRRRRRFL